MWGRKRVGCGVGRASRRRQFLMTIHSTVFPHLTFLVLCSFSMYHPGLVDQEPVSHSSPRPSFLEPTGSHPSHAPVYSFISKLFSVSARQRPVLSSLHWIPCSYKLFHPSCAILKSLKLCEADVLL